MSYVLNAFLGQQVDLKIIEEKFKFSKMVPLTSKIGLIPMTKELYDEINNFGTSKAMENWEYLTIDMERQIVRVPGNHMIAYTEIEYFGGSGGQSGIIWKNGIRIFEANFEQDVVNSILRHFGVVTEEFKRDEFDSVGLGRHRDTRDWIQEQQRKD
jgi:hypothetical protein